MGHPVRAWCSQSPAGPVGVSGMQEIAPCDAPTLTNVGFFQIGRHDMDRISASGLHLRRLDSSAPDTSTGHDAVAVRCKWPL